MPDLTEHGMKSLGIAINLLLDSGIKKVDLGHDTIVYKVPSNMPGKYTIHIEMSIDESEEK